MRAAAIGCALTVMVLGSAACHRTRTVALSDALASPAVFVTLDNQTMVLLYTPKVYGAKLTGWVDGKYEEYPTERVKQVQVREPNRTATFALIALGVAAAGTLAYVLTSGGPSLNRDQELCDADPSADGC